MKKIFFILAVSLLSFVSATTCDAQTYSKMPEAQRTKILTKQAHAFYRNHKFKSYRKQFTDNGRVEIKLLPGVSDGTDSKLTGYRNVGKTGYEVKLYTRNDPKLGEYVAATVFFSDKLGKAWGIILPDNTVVTIWDTDFNK